MFIVSEVEADFDQEGELSAAVELRRLFPLITDMAETRSAPGPSPAESRSREHSDRHLSGLAFRPTQFNPEARSRFRSRHALLHSMHVPGQYFQLGWIETAPEKGDRPVVEFHIDVGCGYHQSDRSGVWGTSVRC